jgi:hypothetical protein
VVSAVVTATSGVASRNSETGHPLRYRRSVISRKNRKSPRNRAS